MIRSDHDAIRDRLDEYALELLAPAERQAVEVHVENCAACAKDLRELRLVIEGLARVPEPSTPPPELKARVLAALAATPQPGGTPLQPPLHDATSRSWTMKMFAMSALVTLVIGSTMVWHFERRRADLKGALVQSQAQTAALQDRLDELDDQADLAVSILTAGDMRPIDLAPPTGPRAGVARAYWSPTHGLMLVADALPQPPPGRVYQVWVIGGAGATPVSAGILGDTGPRRGILLVRPPQGLGITGKVTVAVTDEPPGGLPAPSGSMRLVGSL